MKNLLSAKDAGILAIGNGKGGVGKSTLTVHAAFYFAEQGYKVILIDLDNQGNSSTHLKKYNKKDILSSEQLKYVNKSDTNTILKGTATDLFTRELSQTETSINAGTIAIFEPDISLAEINNTVENNVIDIFRNNVSKLLKHKTVIIFDTPPTLGNLLLIPLSISHVVVIPTILKSYATDGIKHYLEFAQKIKNAVNEDLIIGGIVPNLVNKKSKIQKEALYELNRDGKESNLIYTEQGEILHFPEKNVIEEAAELGIATWHINKTSSRPVKRTFFTLFNQIGKQLKLSTSK